MGVIYRSPIVGTGTEADPFRSPYAGDGVGWIDLGPVPRTAGVALAGIGLLYLPDAVADARLTKIADTAIESSSTQTRNRLANALGINLTTNKTIAALMAEILMDHGRTDGSRWRGIRGCPSKARLAHEVWLGALGRIWFEPVAPTPSTQVFTETWPSDGTTFLTTQDQPWTVVAGVPEVAGGVVRATTGAGAVIQCDSVLDTPSQRHTATFAAGLTAGTNNFVETQVRWSDGSNRYCARANRRSSGGPVHDRLLDKVVATVFTNIIADDGIDPGATGTIMVEVDGASCRLIVGSRDATGTDGSPELLTNVLGAIRLGGAATLQTLDNHTIEDIVAASAGLVPQWGWGRRGPIRSTRRRRRAR